MNLCHTDRRTPANLHTHTHRETLRHSVTVTFSNHFPASPLPLTLPLPDCTFRNFPLSFSFSLCTFSASFFLFLYLSAVCCCSLCSALFLAPFRSLQACSVDCAPLQLDVRLLCRVQARTERERERVRVQCHNGSPTLSALLSLLLFTLLSLYGVPNRRQKGQPRAGVRYGELNGDRHALVTPFD